MPATVSKAARGPAGPVASLRRRRLPVAVAWLAAVAVCLALLWRGVTVVPESQLGHTDLAGNPTFDARSFVGAIWTSRVLPLLHDHAADAAVVLAALAQNPDQAGARYGRRPPAGDGPWTFIVHGQGRIKAAETQLRHATLLLDVGGHDLSVQIGPVIFGTTLRDSLPFVSFAQVVNQIQFAQVSRELNDRATAAVRVGLDVARLVPGARVSFAGAMAAGQPPQLTAVLLHVLPGAAP